MKNMTRRFNSLADLKTHMVQHDVQTKPSYIQGVEDTLKEPISRGKVQVAFDLVETAAYTNTPFRYLAVISGSDCVVATFQRLGACRRFVEFARQRDEGLNRRGFEVFDAWEQKVVPAT